MNSTVNDSVLIESNCSLRQRVYTSDYSFFKLLSSINLRILIGPGILLNTLCIIVLHDQDYQINQQLFFSYVFLQFLIFWPLHLNIFELNLIINQLKKRKIFF